MLTLIEKITILHLGFAQRHFLSHTGELGNTQLATQIKESYGCNRCQGVPGCTFRFCNHGVAENSPSGYKNAEGVLNDLSPAGQSRVEDFFSVKLRPGYGRRRFVFSGKTLSPTK